MARGWESKSVEAQIESFESNRSAEIKDSVSSTHTELLRKKEGLRLARARVLRDLETVQNSRYREILNAALADLDRKLAEFA